VIVGQLVEKFPTFYETQRLITVFTRTSHCIVSQTYSLQGFWPCFFRIHFDFACTTGISKKKMYYFFLHPFHNTGPHQLRSFLFELAINILWEVQIMEIPSMHSLQLPDTSFILDPNSSVCTTSRKFSFLCSVLIMRDRVWHPSTSTNKVIVSLYLNFYVFVHVWKTGGQDSAPNGSKYLLH